MTHERRLVRAILALQGDRPPGRYDAEGWRTTLLGLISDEVARIAALDRRNGGLLLQGRRASFYVPEEALVQAALTPEEVEDSIRREFRRQIPDLRGVGLFVSFRADSSTGQPQVAVIVEREPAQENRPRFVTLGNPRMTDTYAAYYLFEPEIPREEVVRPTLRRPTLFEDGVELRAEALFLSALTPKQKEEYRVYQRVSVTGNLGGRYIIDCTRRAYNVIHPASGNEYCAILPGYPKGDIHFAQLINLQTNEAGFWAVANRSGSYEGHPWELDTDPAKKKGWATHLEDALPF